MVTMINAPELVKLLGPERSGLVINCRRCARKLAFSLVMPLRFSQVYVSAEGGLSPALEAFVVFVKLGAAFEGLVVGVGDGKNGGPRVPTETCNGPDTTN